MTASPPQVTDRPVARRFIRPVAWLPPAASVLAGTALIAWQGARYGSWIVDDAAITFAYARNLAEGFGPVLQPGAAPVEGFSNPAWLGLLTVGKLLGLFDTGSILGVPDYVLFPKALALLCCLGMLVASYVAAKRIARYPWVVTLATGAILAAVPSFVIWSFSGLENSLYALAAAWLGVVTFCATLDGRLLTPRVAVYAGLLAALAALTRPDGLVYVAAYPIVVLIHLRSPRWWASARSALLSVLAFAVPYGSYLAWRLAEFGHLTSMPAVAKRQEVPEAADLIRVGEVVQYAGALAVLALAVVIGLALAGPSRLRDGLVALLVPLGLALIAYAVLEPDWMGQLRFATPVWALGALTASLACYRVLARPANRSRVVLGIVLVAALVPSVEAFRTTTNTFRANPTVPMCLVADQYGGTFNGYADILGIDRGSLVLPDVGGPAMTSRLALVDLAGLAEERMARYWGNGDMAGLVNYVFEEVRPTFIHAHPPWSTGTGVTADPRVDRDYYKIYDSGAGSTDWVRKSAVTSQAQLDELRDYGATTARKVLDAHAAAPRGRCGAKLVPGQLPG